MDFLSHKKELSSTESAHIIIFFVFRNNTATPRHRTEKRNTNEKKNVILYLLRALVVAKEKRDEREMPGNPPPLTRLLLPCWQDVMLDLGTDSLRECQREILNRAGFPT